MKLSKAKRLIRRKRKGVARARRQDRPRTAKKLARRIRKLREFVRTRAARRRARRHARSVRAERKQAQRAAKRRQTARKIRRRERLRDRFKKDAKVRRYPNGRIPKRLLVYIGSGEYLAPGPARALFAAQRAAGEQWYVTDGYRSFEEQVHLYRLYMAGKGNLAAVPGRSNHGWGIAVDIPDPGQSFLVRNPHFGFRRTVSGEPWHLEKH